MRKLQIIVSTFFFVLIIIGCDAVNSGGNTFEPPGDNNRSRASEVTLDKGKSPDDFIFDHYEVVEYSIAGDSLYVKATYSGGCNQHDFGLSANDYFMESFPVQTNLVLHHNSHDDACDAIITVELFFDLTPLKSAYYNSYGNNSDPIVMNILVDKATDRWLRITYHPSAAHLFSFDTSDDVTGWEGLSPEMLVDDTPPMSTGKSLYIGGGCLQPAASNRILISEAGSYYISCWGKTNHNGGNILLKYNDEEISINIKSGDWSFYKSNGSITCDAGDVLILEFWVGGIVYDDLFCDDLAIRKL